MNGLLFMVRQGDPGSSANIRFNQDAAVDFFNHLNMLYGTVTEFCTPQEVRTQLSPAYSSDLNLLQ
jgi:hypothetical protein